MTTLQDVDRRLTVVETGLQNVATKTDIAALEGRMDTFATKADLAVLEARISALDARVDATATKSDLAELETRLVKWLVGILIGSTAAASTIAVLVQTLIG